MFTCFIAAHFTVAKTWNQPRCSTTEEKVKKMWYMCVCETDTIEHHSAIKKRENKYLVFCNKRMQLETIKLSDIS